GPRGPVADPDVGDVDAAAHDVSELAAGLAQAPFGDGHDALDLPGDVADPSDIALPIDRRRARLQDHIADPQGPRVVRQLLERSSRRHVDPAIRFHRFLLSRRTWSARGPSSARAV